MAVNYPFQITEDLYDLSFFDRFLNNNFNNYFDNDTLTNISDVIKKYGIIGKDKNAKSELLYSYINLIFYLTYLQEQLQSLSEEDQNSLLQELNKTDFKCFKDNLFCQGEIFNPNQNNICGCLSYNLETGYYDLPCTPDVTITTIVVAPEINTITFIPETLPNNYNGQYFLYTIDGNGLVTSGSRRYSYELEDPEIIEENTCFVIRYDGDRENTGFISGTGANYTEQGLVLGFDTNYKQLLSTYRTYLFKRENSEWFVYDVTGTKYSEIDVWQDVLYVAPSTTDYFLQGNIHFRFRRTNTTCGRYIVLPNPAYNRNEYIKITTEPTFTILAGASEITGTGIPNTLLTINTTYEFYSDGTNWSIV